MKAMPGFCHFWRMTPPEMLRLTVGEYHALRDYQERYQREEQRLIAEAKALANG